MYSLEHITCNCAVLVARELNEIETKARATPMKHPVTPPSRPLCELCQFYLRKLTFMSLFALWKVSLHVNIEPSSSG